MTGAKADLHIEMYLLMAANSNRYALKERKQTVVII